MAKKQGVKSNILLESGTNELEVITFSLEWLDPISKSKTRSSYGINAAKVRELVALPEEITEVVDSPHAVKGVFLLRDRTIPLVDLCEWFRYEIDESTDMDRRKWVVIVAELNGKPFGFISHGVDKVHRISWSQIAPPPEILSGSQSITGICQVNEQIIQMIDFEKIIAEIDPSMNIQTELDDDTVQEIEKKYDKKVLVADDSQLVRLQLKRTLEKDGFTVVAHNDGQAAWEYLEDLREKGELDSTILSIISDIEMPRMDGHNFCKRVRQQSAYSKIPVILFSSMINDALRRKGEALGADDQITKPEIDDLINRMQVCIEKLNS
jgi:two-component system chemotaxis response regulator CheV